MTSLGDPEGDGALAPPPVTEEELADPILGSPLATHPEVRRRVNYWILRWQTWGQGYFNRYLERMGRYAVHVDAAIEERDLPLSLRYLPIVESGYNPAAVSRVGAAGMWQFMSATARFLDMDVSPLVDERRDPWRSTEVALDYLTELRDRFDGSWFLALAAYNGGWGRVQRVIERHGEGAAHSDSLFWALRDRFPRETRDFVPKLLAAARLARQPATYGFEPFRDVRPLDVEEVRVPDATSLDVVAEAAGVSLEEVERLNPHILRGYTPPDRETALRVPAGSGKRFAERYAAVPASERVSFVEHKVRRGETLTHLTVRYGVGMDELRAANPGLDPRRLQIGQWVVVPRSPTSAVSDAVRTVAAAEAAGSGDGRQERGATARSTAAGTSAGGTVHRVRAGESLWVIARRNGVGVDDLRGWNGLGRGATLHPGDELRIRGRSASTVHQVRSGESLWVIARRHGVGVDALRRWNGLARNATLYPGDGRRIRGSSTAVYRVRAGDTLSDIARRHGVGTERLLRVNDLSRSSVIRPGDEVRIPAVGGS